MKVPKITVNFDGLWVGETHFEESREESLYRSLYGLGYRHVVLAGGNGTAMCELWERGSVEWIQDMDETDILWEKAEILEDLPFREKQVLKDGGVLETQRESSDVYTDTSPMTYLIVFAEDKGREGAWLCTLKKWGSEGDWQLEDC